jgi:hypothetical protein
MRESQPLGFDLKWSRCVDGYKLADNSTIIESNSPDFEIYRPLKNRALFAEFADQKPTPQGMLEFANQYGLMIGKGAEQISTGGSVTKRFTAAKVDELLKHHAEFKSTFAAFEKGNPRPLIEICNWSPNKTALQFQIVRRTDDELTISMTPPDLRRAMWILFALHACNRTELFRCEHCSKPFIVGTGTGRRSTSKFCSPACTNAAFQEKLRRKRRR